MMKLDACVISPSTSSQSTVPIQSIKYNNTTIKQNQKTLLKIRGTLILRDYLPVQTYIGKPIPPSQVLM